MRRLPVVFFQKQTCKTTDDFRRSNNACTDKCKHLPTEQWQEDLVNKLTILSPLLYSCYATKVHALSDLLMETLVVCYRCYASLHKRVDGICFWKASGSHRKLPILFNIVLLLHMCDKIFCSLCSCYQRVNEL